MAPAGESTLDSVVSHSGRLSLRISQSPLTEDSPGAALRKHALREWVAPQFAWGQRLRVTGWIWTDDLQGSAWLSAETWGNFKVLAVESSEPDSGAHIAGTSSWTRHEIEIPVDSAAHSIYVTAATRGAGTAWFDDLTVEVDGVSFDAVPVARAPSPSEVAFLLRHSAALRTVDATRPGERADFSDLSPVADIVGDARIVALGEATHGTSEFFRVKHRLTEFLVSELGITLFAIEANQLAAEQVNAYVHGTGGDAGQVMRVMFRVWNTEEVLALIEWMRDYNARNPDRMVEFVGFDMQDPRLPMDSLRAFLTRYDPALVARADSLHGDYREAWRQSFYPQAPDGARRVWQQNAAEMWRLVSNRRMEWLDRASTASDSAAVEWAVQSANLVRQAATAAFTMRLEDRDSAMAANLDWALAQRGPQARAIVWAHNAHVSRGSDPETSFYHGASMGAYLSRTHGNDLRVFGLATYDGQYSATVSRTDHRIVAVDALSAPVGSVEEGLHRCAQRLGAAQLVTDLRPARSEEDGRWLLEARPIRMIGYAAADYGFEQRVAVAGQFDGLIFIDRTTPSRLLP